MKRTRIKPRSKKRLAEVEQRRAVVAAVFHRDWFCCQAKTLVPQIRCWGELDAHELLSRGRGGDYLDPENVTTLCRAHHDWCHDHPLEATAVGLLKSAHHHA